VAAEPDDSLAHLPEAATLLGMGGMDESPELADFTFADEVHDLAPAIDELGPAIDEPAPLDLEPVSTLDELSSVAPEPASPLEIGGSATTVPAAGGQAPAVPGHDMLAAEQAPGTSEQARAVVQVILADPVLVDALVRAVVARMGDQVLREIAWEVMPELAGRLQG
jgi:hypothetical protein